MIVAAWRTLLLTTGAFFFRFRNFLFPAFVIILLVFTKPALFLGRRDLDAIIVTFGFLVAMLGIFFRLFVIGFAYIKRGGKDGRVYADNLVIEGVYAHVRNPMYVANFFNIVGIALIYGSFWVYVLVIPFFTYVYLAIVTTEENYLHKRFGAEFETYCKAVNRFIPNFSGIKQTLGKFSYDWTKALRKEYGTTFGVLLGCYVMWLRKMYSFYGATFSRHTVFFAVAPVVFLVLLYSFVRYLKKSGRLSS
ncbi:MAG: isoprenylcysteine carboxylmethyltransferase family protein [Candidatus Omnitrophota bacterium]